MKYFIAILISCLAISVNSDLSPCGEDDDTAECLPKPECGCNEVLSECASPCGEPSCVNPRLEGIICAAVCITGCVCKPGFIRDRKGVCIPKSQCPRKRCERNEVFSTCVKACAEPTCEVRYNGACADFCRIGCFCKKGYARDINGNCIRESKCPRNRCDKKTEDYSCNVRECEKVCGRKTYKDFCMDISSMCEMGCYCKDGFARNQFNNKCIPQEECGCK